MNIVNLTPHALSVRYTDGALITIAPSGVVARVATVDYQGEPVAGLPVVHTSFGEVHDLPEPTPGTILIVSGMVAARAQRADVFSPGPLVRDDAGRPVGCKGLRSSVPAEVACPRCGECEGLYPPHPYVFGDECPCGGEIS